MDFFGIGIGEILLILVIALIIWGPGRIAEIGRTLGKVVRNLRKVTSDVAEQLTRETEEQEKEQLPEQRKGGQDISRHEQ